MKTLKTQWTLFAPETPAPWIPRADVYRTREGWLLKFLLPGVRLDDLTVSARGRRLLLTGVRRDSLIEEGAYHYSMEISYNRFERSIDLPESLDGARIALSAQDGILFVRVRTQIYSEGSPR